MHVGGGPATQRSFGVTWCCSDGPSTYSLMMYGWVSTAPTSSTRAVRNSATRRNRRTAAASSSSLECSSLIATRSPEEEVPR
ncbi:hypothetical protein LDL08_24090 [Nonomuraea glycinis]|uniref:hypothetical protein n=1 Tax=Nonomuraea glycinis TaxID=2047744 RepID=UPI001662A2C3|nr:hypothetical protein [Nonomuraea glycinis]MCA2179276.1 hypothetical protein [Nonomuraea glycinis]